MKCAAVRILHCIYCIFLYENIDSNRVCQAVDLKLSEGRIIGKFLPTTSLRPLEVRVRTNII